MDTDQSNSQASLLELQGVIGFDGSALNGLLLHPGDQHIIYPLGSTVVVRHLTQNTQTFLQKKGQNANVSCLALSSTGKYLASGTATLIGFEAPVTVWNLETYEIVHELILHKGQVQDLSFSPDEKFLVTLGGRDDNKVVIWDMEKGSGICGSTASMETALTVRFINSHNDMIATAGFYNLRVWTLDLANRKIRPSDCQLGSLRRIVRSITTVEEVNEAGQLKDILYCGTETGDVLKILVGDKNLFTKSGPPKKPFSQGVLCSLQTNDGNLVIGAGDGTVALLSKDLKIIRKVVLSGGITSLALNAAGDHFFAGTDLCNIYLVALKTFEFELRNTCHYGKINDVAFPRGYSELFATASAQDIRVWHARTRNELLRIQVPNLECYCIAFAPDGKSIISGWSDGKIRGFKPQTGKLVYAINDAHRDGVTALTCASDCQHIISGGENGQVRVWKIGRATQQLVASLKEHKGRINSVQISADDTQCVSASVDGTCIIWNLERCIRETALFASTQFSSGIYHPDHSQILTAGSDRKLTYWDVADGSPIRILEGSSDNINCLAITETGDKFVSAGGEKLVKVWAYDEGYCMGVGVGHSGSIQKCTISPDQQTIVSVGQEGAIFLWTMPTQDQLSTRG